MKNLFRNIVSASVAVAIALSAMPVSAQMAPSGDHPQPVAVPTQVQQTPRPMQSNSNTDGVSSLEMEYALVAGSTEDIRTRVSEPDPLRPMNLNDRVTKIPRSTWVKRGWSNESFDAMRRQNVGLCQRTLYFASKFADLEDRYTAAMPRIDDFDRKYDKMRKRIKTAGTFRTIGNILTPIIATVASGGAYGAVVLPNSVSNEITGRASTKQQLLANEAGQFNNVLTGYHIEFSLASLELYQDYLGMMTGYCTNFGTVISYNGTAR